MALKRKKLDQKGSVSSAVKMSDDSLVSISQAAKILGVSLDTVRRWDKNGTLKSKRPDGKNRFFKIDDIEAIKFSEPLTIGEASEQLNMSASTLRRLEEKGMISPERNDKGERVYNREALQSFIRSNYFLRQKEVEAEILEPLEDRDKQPFDIDDKESKNSKGHDPLAHALLGEHHSSIENLHRFKTIILKSVKILAAAFVLIVAFITIMFFLFPESTSKNLGYFKYNPTSKKFVYQAPDSLVARQLRPFSETALRVVEFINTEKRQQIAPFSAIEDVNDIFRPDQDGNISSIYSFTVPDSSYLVIPDQGLVENLNSDYLRGYKPGTQPGDLAILPIGGNQILDGSITAADLDPSIKFGNTIISGGGGSTSGIKNVVAGAGLNGGGGSDVITLNVGVGDGLTALPDSIGINTTTSGTTSITASNSGLEVSAGGLRLLGGCSDGQVLAWSTTFSQWQCSTSAGGGGGSLAVEEGDITVSSAITTLDFSASDFIIYQSPVGEANIALDYANSGITRSSQNETITGAWTFNGGFSCTDCIELGSETTGDYVATATSLSNGLVITGSGSENATLSFDLDVDTTGTTLTTLSNSGLEIGTDGLRLLGGCSSGEILKWNAAAWACAEDSTGGGGGGTADSFTQISADAGTSPLASGSDTLSLLGGDGLVTTGNATADSITFDIGAGDGIIVDADAIRVDVATSGNTLVTSSNSGLEVGVDGLRLLGGCSSGQILKWNGSAWACAADSTGGGGGGSSIWSDLLDPTANLALQHGEFSTVFSWNADNAISSNLDGLTLEYVNDGVSDPNLQRILVLKNQDNGISDVGSIKTEVALRIEHNDDSTLDKGIQIIGSVSPGGTINTGLDVSSGRIRDAVNVGANNIVGSTADIKFDNLDFNGSFGIFELGGLAYYTGDGDTTYSSGGGGELYVDSSGGQIITGNGDVLNVGNGSPNGLAYHTISNSGGSANGGDVADDNDLYIQGALEVDGNFNLGGDFKILGTSIETNSNITLNVAGAGAGVLQLANNDTINIGGITGLPYNAISNVGGAANSGLVTDDNDLYIQGGLELDGDFNLGGDFTILGTTITASSVTTFDCSNCLDYDDFSDSLSLDASTTTALGAYDYTFNLDGTGDFILQDNGVAFLNINDNGSYSYSLNNTDNPGYLITNNGSSNINTNLVGTGDITFQDNGFTFVNFSDGGNTTFSQQAASWFNIDAASANNTTTTGVFDLDVSSVTANNVGLNVDYTSADGVSSGSDLFAAKINIRQNDTDGDLYGLTITSQSTSVTNAGGIECLLCLMNEENQFGFINDGLRIGSTSGIEGTITRGLHFDTTDIAIDIELQNGETIDNNVDGLILFTSDTTQSSGVFLVGDGLGNDYLSFSEESSNPSCGLGDYRIWANSTESLLKKCQNGALSDLDAAGAWNQITPPTDNLTLNHQEFTSEFQYITPATAAQKNYFTFSTTNASTTDSSTQNVVVIANNDDAGATGSPEALLLIANNDINEVVDSGIAITSAAGGITNGIDASSSDILNAINVGANTITGTSFLINATTGDLNLTSTTDGINFVLGGGAGDDFIVDTDTFVVESDNNRVGIGTASPLGQLQVESSSYMTSQILINNGVTGAPPTYPGGISPTITVASSETSGSRPLFFGYDSGSSWNAFITAGACGNFSQMCLSLGQGTTYRTALQNVGSTLQLAGGDDGNFVDVEFRNTGNFDVGDIALTTKKIDIGGNTNNATDTINIATNASSPDTINIGNAGSSTLVNIDAGTSGVTIDSTGLISIDANGQASNMSLATDSAADDLTIAVTGATNSSLILSSSGTADDALQILATAGGIDITTTGAAAGEDIDISSSSSLNLIAQESTADAINIVAAAASGGITVTAGTGDIDINLNGTGADFLVDAGGGISLDSIGSSSNFSVNGVGLALTLEARGGGANILNLISDGTGSNAINIDVLGAGGDLDIDVNDAITIDAGAGGITARTSGGDITLGNSSGAGDIILQTDANSNVQVNSVVTNTVDLVSINNTGLGTTTDGVDGLSIAFTQAAATGERQNSGLRLDIISGASEADDNLEAIFISDLVGASSGSETAIRIGANWDTGLAIGLSDADFDSLDVRRRIDVVGSWGGNAYFETNTFTGNPVPDVVTAEAVAYELQALCTSNTDGNYIHDVTGLPDTNGTFAYFYTQTQATDTTDIGSNTCSLTLRINGNDVNVNEVTATAGLATETTNDYESFTAVRINGQWRAIGIDSPTPESTGTDLAEWTPYSGEQPVAGEVVVIDPSVSTTVRKSSDANQKLVVGIVATEPGITLGTDDGNSVQLALAGRVPVKVSLENGDIKAGDYLTSSSTPGIAMKSSGPGAYIAKAYEDHNGGETVIAFIETGWYGGDIANSLLKHTEEGILFDIGSDQSVKIGSGAEIFADGSALFGDISSEKIISNEIGERYYARSSSLEIGDVVSLDKVMKRGVQKSKKEYDPELVGVVSGSPSLLFGEKEANGYEYVVATIGNIAVKVTDDNGPISAGDPLTASNTPGYAMRATKPGPIIGYAMHDFNGTGTVLTRVGGAYSAGNELNEKVEQIDGRVVMLEGKVTGLSNAQLEDNNKIDENEDGLSDNSNIDWENVSVGNLVVSLDAIVKGSLTVNGNSEFIGSAVFKNTAIFSGDTFFEKSPTFGSDVAGYVTILPGATTADVVFSKPMNALPSVLLTLGEGPFVSYKYQNLTKNGFQIAIDKPQTEAVNISWSTIMTSLEN